MQNIVKRYGSWALVTGASSGIGLEFAHQLAAQQMNLVLVARRAERLGELARELEVRHGVQVLPIARDLTQPGSVEALHAQLAGREIDVVIANAGIESSGHFTKIPLERHVELQTLNVDVPMRLASLFGSAMVRRQRGALVFVASLFGYQGVPLVANYAASKAYLLSLGEALHVEMKPFGVDVLVVSPGLTDTAMPAQMPIDFAKMPITRGTPQRVVSAALQALGRQATVVPGLVNKFYAWQNRLLPRSWPVRLFGVLIGHAFHRHARAQHLHSAT